MTPKLTTSNSTNQLGPGGANTNKELNIQVVLRCRTRSEREQKENSPVVVTSQNREIQVPSTLGDRAPSKTYTFDRVFMYADQESIYNDVVTPILDEVLMGYNCTIFAYGQTGTGKTYTMEGDLRDHYGECSPEAGIIPRTLYQLFASLERKETEYSVRISFLELYNEEVKDLLTNDDDRKVVKIFDVSKKGGPLVQGLEEVAVYSAIQGIEALRRGSARRTVAATKSNDKSSRSHGVFSITVHVKETTDDGEELLKIGKLNLVDLAGSENIARSGAEFNQAREAGRINQSLLTLGRVINCLVERSPHVPYRESKLTRLLEDSLGGKTKTCIIATISPARACLEETISTLNYANRAKSIKNTPEINQKMSKKTLIKEYLLEIDRLKNDLIATREKNGVFMTKESYESMVDESKSNKDLVAETLKQAEKTAAELQRVEEKFRENLKLLTATEFKLNQSIAELGVKEQELQESKDELTRTKQDLMEESVLRKAHADTEQELKTMMAEIRLDLLKSVTDNKGLHEKLERKQTIEQKNKDALQEFQNKVLQLSGELTDQIQGFGKTHSQIWVTVSRNMDEAHQEATRGVEEIQLFLNTQLDRMAKAAEAFKSKKQGTDEGAQTFHQEFESVRNETLAFLQQTSEATQTIAVEGFDSLKKALAEFCSAVEGHHTTMTDGVVELVDETTKFSENQAQQLLQALDSYQKATHAEVDFLTKENQKLREELEKQRQLGASSRQTLLTNIGGLLDEFLNDQSNALMGHFLRASSEQEASTGRLIAANNHQQAWAGDFNQERQASLKQLVYSRQAFASTGQEIKQSITQQGGALYTRTDGVLAHLQETLNAHQTSIQTRVDTLSSQALEGYQHLQTRNTELADMHAQSSASTLSTLENLKGRSTNLQLGADRGYNRAVDEIRSAERSLKSFSDDANINLHSTREEVEDLLPRRFKADDSTGRTPARRQTNVPQTLPVTRPEKDILKELRELGRVDVVSEERAFDNDFAMTPDDSDDDFMHSAKQEYQSATVSSRAADIHPDANPFIATTAQDPVAKEDDLEDRSGLLSPIPCTTRSSSQPTTRQEECEGESSVFKTVSGIPTLFGASARPLRPGKGTHLFQQLKSERGDGKFSGVGSFLSSKRPHSDVDESEVNNVTPANIQTSASGSPASSAVSGISELGTNSSSVVTTATLAGVPAQKIAGAASTLAGPPTLSSTKPSIFSFGSGKTGTTNGSEGPRKISRPVAKKPTFR
ncbi:MAG: P-loop containing nucleoside triphosphate hydrolase protein [Podila humilis]|nr:MAG: P-loop containing nucleoside triphosphate hydrolase protein [Podila humilis]